MGWADFHKCKIIIDIWLFPQSFLDFSPFNPDPNLRMQDLKSPLPPPTQLSPGNLVSLSGTSWLNNFYTWKINPHVTKYDWLLKENRCFGEEKTFWSGEVIEGFWVEIKLNFEVISLIFHIWSLHTMKWTDGKPWGGNPRQK